MFDHRSADLSEVDRALCDLAVKPTLSPGMMTPDDLDVLRGHGFDDAAITIAVQVISYFNYINRAADALGVDDESWFKIGREDWLARKGREREQRSHSAIEDRAQVMGSAIRDRSTRT